MLIKNEKFGFFRKFIHENDAEVVHGILCPHDSANVT